MIDSYLTFGGLERGRSANGRPEHWWPYYIDWNGEKQRSSFQYEDRVQAVRWLHRHRGLGPDHTEILHILRAHFGTYVAEGSNRIGN